MSGSVYSYVLVFVFMCRIHSRHFHSSWFLVPKTKEMRIIFVNLEVKVNEYLQILDVRISSYDYSSINERMLENIDIWLFLENTSICNAGLNG